MLWIFATYTCTTKFSSVPSARMRYVQHFSVPHKLFGLRSALLQKECNHTLEHFLHEGFIFTYAVDCVTLCWQNL